MRALLKFFLRTSAFIGKEIREIIRQPRLVLDQRASGDLRLMHIETDDALVQGY